MKTKCGICLETKECLTFPCCNDKFPICKTCLEKHPKTCPQCRKEFNVIHTTTSSKVINWFVIFEYITYILFIISIVVTFVFMIDRIKQCKNQSCNDEINKNNNTYYCECNLENNDIIAPIIYIVGYFVFHTTFLTIDFDNQTSNSFNNVFRTCRLAYITITGIYVCIEQVYYNYHGNYEADFIQSWTFIFLIHLAASVVFGIVCIIIYIVRHAYGEIYKTNTVSPVISSIEPV